MISSKELIETAGISRATLNNYVGLGLLPKPVVTKSRSSDGKAPRLGYFPDNALDTVRMIKDLKGNGQSMSEIIESIKADGPTAANDENGDERRDQPNRRGVFNRRTDGVSPTMSQSGGLSLTLDQVNHPAYLVNSMFELEWSNEQADVDLLDLNGHLSANLTERNIFSILLNGAIIPESQDRYELIRFHLAIAKNRISKKALLTMDPDMELDDIEALAKIYDVTEPVPAGEVATTVVNLAPHGEEAKCYTIYTSFFREGIFFAFSPVDESTDSILSFLGRRDIVIRDLLKKRKPYLTPLAVIVADIQDSVKICAELPPEEYFELINDVWGAMEPNIRKYYATHGKHVGDGMVYYFFPQPDCSYVMNAIQCAFEMKEAMREISREWRKRKNWLNELKLNIGLHEGQEWFGAYQTPTHLEFTALGETINYAGRLSDFAREGSIWVSKNMVGKLTAKERSSVRYGIRRTGADGSNILVPESYSRISNLLDLDNPKNLKFKDIAVMPVTEVLDIESGDRKKQDED